MGLTTVNKLFPLQLWDELIKQGELTFNLLCKLSVNLQLYTYAQLKSVINFNETLLAYMYIPAGHCMLLMHGMFALPSNIISATGSGHQNQEVLGLLKQNKSSKHSLISQQT